MLAENHVVIWETQGTCALLFDQIFSIRDNEEGGVRGVQKPQNRTEIRQKTANRIGFFPEFRNRA